VGVGIDAVLSGGALTFFYRARGGRRGVAGDGDSHL
jgi:hypothetical protein